MTAPDTTTRTDSTTATVPSRGSDVVSSAGADVEMRAPLSSVLSLVNHFHGIGGIGVSRIVGYGKSGTTTRRSVRRRTSCPSFLA